MVWLSSSELKNKTDKDLASKNFVAVHVGFALLSNTLWAVSTLDTFLHKVLAIEFYLTIELYKYTKILF